MSWIINAGRQLNLGGEAGAAFQSFFLELLEKVDGQDLPLREAIELIRGGETPGSLVWDLADRLLQHSDVDAVKDLLKTVGEVERRRAADDRSIGWPLLSWTKELPATDQELVLKLKAEAGASLQVIANDKPRSDGLPDVNGAAATALKFHGELAPGLKASGTLDSWVLSGTLDARLRRSADYHFDVNSEASRVGKVIAGSITRVVAPYDFGDVQAAMAPTGVVDLVAIELAGAQGLTAGAKVAVTIPGAAVNVPGTIGLKLGGRFATDKNFRIVVTRGAGDGLLVRALTGRSRVGAFDIGAAYRLGLADLPVASAHKLLEAGSKAGKFLKRFDDLLDDAESWLKPGTLLVDEIESRVRGALPGAGQDTEPFDPRAILARNLLSLFGGDRTEPLSEQIIEGLSQQTTALITEIVDDSLGVYEGIDDDLKRRFTQAITGRLTDSARRVLEDSVIDRITPLLREKISGTADHLDDTFRDALTEALGTPPESLLAGARQAVEEARGYLTQVLKGIQTSVVDLLAIEIGYDWARSRSAATRFEASFKSSQHEAFKQAILGPSRFVGAVLSGDPSTEDLDIEALERVTTLERSTGLQFGISVASISFTGGRVRKSEIERVETTDGVRILARSEFVKNRSFWNERRELSFISANALYRLRESEPLDSSAGPTEATFKVDAGRHQPPRFSLLLSEYDRKIGVRDIETFLERFERVRVIDKAFETRFKGLVAAARAAVDNRDLKAMFSISLAIPPDQIRTLFAFYGNQQPGAMAALSVNGTRAPQSIADVAARALVLADPESINEAFPERRDAQLLDMASGPLPGFAPLGLEALQRDPQARARLIMDNLDALIARVDSAPGQPRFGALGIEDELSGNALKRLREATRALPKTFAAGHELISTSQKLTNRQIMARQDAMVGHIKDFLTPGVPAPGAISFLGKVPHRLVGLYRAMQDLAEDALEVRPPVIFRFQPDEGDEATLIAMPKQGL